MKRFLKITTLTLMALGLLSACGKGGGGGKKSVATTGLTASCGNCGNVARATQFANAQLQGGNITGTISLHGDYLRVQQATQQSMFYRRTPDYVYNYFTGPVILAGQIVVQAPIETGSCVIPPGNYQLRTVSVGNKVESGAGSRFSVQEVVFDGHRDIRATVPEAEYFPSSRQAVITFNLKAGPQRYNPNQVGPCL